MRLIHQIYSTQLAYYVPISYIRLGFTLRKLASRVVGPILPSRLIFLVSCQVMGSRLQCGRSREGTLVFMRLRSAYGRLTAFILPSDYGRLCAPQRGECFALVR
jgi:hypothetical protein